MEIDKMYTKLLVAQYSPKNGCNVEEGITLTVIPKKDLKQKDHVSHCFIDGENKKTRSKYGWVKTVDSFTLQDFVKKHSVNAADEREAEHIRIMLESISKFPDGTPIAATYSQRGVEQKIMAFTVHKVFFYKG